MSWPHIHITINHFPVIGVWIALIVLAVGVMKNHGTVEKVGLKILTGLAIISPVVYWTGEQAEEQLPTLTNVPNPAGIIAHHETFAFYSMTGLILLGILGVAGVVARASGGGRLPGCGAGECGTSQSRAEGELPQSVFPGNDDSVRDLPGGMREESSAGGQP